MNIKILIPYFFILITLFISCSENYINKKEKSNSTQIHNAFYLNDKYKIELAQFDTQKEYEKKFNSIFTFLKKSNEE